MRPESRPENGKESSSSTAASLNMTQVQELAFRVVGDMGGAFIMALGYIGDRLGLFKAMAGARRLAEQAGFTSFEKLPIENPFNQFFALGR